MNGSDEEKVLEFNLHIGKKKPDTVHRKEPYCPFCDVENLKGILAKDGLMIWLKNAFPVLKNTYPTLIIETDNDDGEFSVYAPAYAERLIRFALDKWYKMKDSGRFKSVLFYRNYGYMSGGTIHHPHIQIVGLEDYDYHDTVHIYHLQGDSILKDKEIEINLSDKPLLGFYEINMILRNTDDLPVFTRYMQDTAFYITHRFSRFTNSYNMFFYDFPEEPGLYVKLIPRFLTNPLYIGYKIPQITDSESRQKLITSLRQLLLKEKE